MMMITTDTGRTFKLHFMHSAPPKSQAELDAEKDAAPPKDRGENRKFLDEAAQSIQRRLTVCLVDELGDDPQQAVTLGEGVALCHPSDAFKKSVGRKLSLTYALAAATDSISRNERAQVWAAYLDQFGR